MNKLITLSLTAILLAGTVHAGAIERACKRSDRAAGKQALCNCIQQVADVTLDRRDQRMAAKFFKDPHMAQEIRQSDRSSHEVFWKKYRAFGSAAETYCS